MSLPQKSSARIKRHYILFSSSDREKIKNILTEYLGLLGWSKAAAVFVDADISNCAVLAVNPKEVDHIRAALELSSENIKIIRVSGTLKGLGQ